MEGLSPESPGNMITTDSRNTFSDQLSVDIRFSLSHRVTVLRAADYTVTFTLLSNSLYLREHLLECELGNGRGWKM